MIKSLIYIRIATEAPATYAVPLLEQLKQELPGITAFEFDNYSEESIRQYALELLKQSERAAILVEAPVAGTPVAGSPVAGNPAAGADAPITGLTAFINRLLKVKPSRLVMVLQGEQPVLQKMMQVAAGEFFYQQLPEKELRRVLHELFS